jgi:signal transduction histidine kinase
MKAFGKINSEESRKLNSQGVGLGLLISNKIAQQLGDGLTLESTYRKGSKFSFTINPGD